MCCVLCAVCDSLDSPGCPRNGLGLHRRPGNPDPENSSQLFLWSIEMPETLKQTH